MSETQRPDTPRDAAPRTLGAVPHWSATALTRLIAALAAGLLTVSFAWFALIDAPISDLAMGIFAAGAGLGVGAVITALLSLESAVSGAAQGELPAPRAARAQRLRRLALILLCLGLVVLTIAATLTLNVKGSGTDDEETATVAA